MRPPPEKNRIMLDFFNKIRYLFSMSARITASLISIIPFFSFFIRLPRSPTPEIRSFSFIRLCQDRTGELQCKMQSAKCKIQNEIVCLS